MQVIVLCIVFFCGTTLAGLPSTIIPCHRSDPDISKCIINRVNSLKPRLATGKIADDFIIPSLEPMKLENIEMSRGSEFKVVFSQLAVRGPSQFQVEKLKVNMDQLIFEFTILLPKLTYNGKYTMKIRLLLLDIAGKGDVNGTLFNTRAKVRLRGHPFEQDGQTFLQFDRFQVKLNVGSSKIYLDNLFNGDPTLGQIGNTFINDNIELFLSEVQPGLEKSLAETFTQTANDILKGATLEEVFPA